MSILTAPLVFSALLLAEPDPGARAEASIRALAGKPFASVTTLTKSRAGHDVLAVRISRVPKDAKAPTLLLAAGLDARHRVGVETAVAIAEKLTAEPPEWLKGCVVWVAPCMNPDAFAAGAAPPAVDFGRVRGDSDADHDRRSGENPAEDLNGDGVISLMRVKDPSPGVGLRATLVDEPDWAGLMRAPDAAKAERPVWALLAEGRDRDGDGRIAEDGVHPEGFGSGGGLDLDRNFPAAWPQFEDGAGVRPLEAPEARALVEWCRATPELVGVVVFGLHDTVVNVPEANKMDASGQLPRGVLGDDKALYDAVSGKYREITGYTDAPRRDDGGSFAEWGYGGLGIPVYETPVWVRPDLVKEEKRIKPPAPPASSAPSEAPKAEAPKPPEAKTEEQKWIRYFQDYGVKGFLPWAPFDHPQLGAVEIGGFVPGARVNPPAAFAETLVASHLEFLAYLAQRTPRIETTVTAERAGAGVWKVRARAVNTGGTATQTAMGVRAREIPPTTLTLEVEPAAIVAGRKRASEPRIAAGGMLEAEWTVLAEDGGSLSVTVSTPTAGASKISVPLAAK